MSADGTNTVPGQPIGAAHRSSVARFAGTGLALILLSAGCDLIPLDTDGGVTPPPPADDAGADGAVTPSCTGSGQCDDGDPCTTDTCATGSCTHVVASGVQCPNGTCDASGTCVVSPPRACTGQDLRFVVASRVDWRSENLRCADLRSTELRFQNFAGLDFTDADLSGADLTGSVLTGANFTRARFIGADLSNTITLGAAFTGADLTRADITGGL